MPPSAPQPNAYTAARYAAVLNVTRQAVRQQLRDVPPSTKILVGGQLTDAWPVDRVPQSTFQRLHAEAVRQNYRDAEALLSAQPVRWQANIPLRQICTDDWTHAQSLQRALVPSLTRTDTADISAAQFERDGINDYSREFGRTITGRYLRELLAMVRERDRGANDWTRLEIFLPKTLTRAKQVARALPGVLAEQFSDIAAFVGACRNPAALNETEQRSVWTLVFQHYDQLVARGCTEESAARKLRDFLFGRVPIARSREALRKGFQRKLSRRHDLGDKRKSNGTDPYEWPQRDLDQIEALIVFQHGQFLPAWQHAYHGGLLSPQTVEQFKPWARRRYYVPKSLTATLGNRPRYLYVLHRRRRDFNSMKAHFDTVYDGLYTLDCISADDVTLPVWMWYQPDPEQPPIITRGQCLVFIDLVSKRILGYSLQPDKNYNALVIYTETAKVFAEKGVPRALLFEHNIWERSKIITGSAPFSVNEVTQGLRDMADLEFFFADTPQGKWEVENVMGLIQNRMEGEPGYCGRAEMRDRPDWIKTQLAAVEPGKRGSVHPSKFFYSFDQWTARLETLFAQYNAAPQCGKHMRDRSPDQVYVENWNHNDRPSRLTPELACLFSHAKYEVEIKPAGFSITSGKRTFKYFGPEIAARTGQRALAWFDPQSPEVAVVTDLDRTNAVFVPLHNGVPRLERLHDSNAPLLTAACERREAQVQPLVARYRVLKDNFELPYRANLVAPEVAQLCNHINVGKPEFINRVNEQRRSRERAQRTANRHGFDLPVNAQPTEETAEALATIAKYLPEKTT